MKPMSHISKKVWGVLAVLLVIQILFDPLTGILRLGEQLQARFGLPQARSKWESQGITHYKFDVSGGFAMGCLFSGNVEVKDGVMIRTGRRSDFGTNNDFYDQSFWTSEDGFSICDPKIYTVPLLFEAVECLSKNTPVFFAGLSIVITDISFDPKYGYISQFHYGNCGGNGLISPRISDCSGGFGIENFQVLDK
jgi:hypothetical protein